jgi:hypothetical protein
MKAYAKLSIMLALFLAVALCFGCESNNVMNNENSFLGIYRATGDIQTSIPISTPANTGLEQMTVGDVLEIHVWRVFEAELGEAPTKTENVTTQAQYILDSGQGVVDISVKGRVVASQPGTALLVVSHKPTDIEREDKVFLQFSVVAQ